MISGGVARSVPSAPRSGPQAVPLRLAILGTRGIPARYGGFETFAQEIAVRLVRLGVDVTVYCEARGPSPAEYNGVHLRYRPAPRIGPLSTILFDGLCLLDARNKFDIVYMLGYGSSVLCSIVKARPSAPSLWINMDGLEWQRSKWGRVAKMWLKASEAAAIQVADLVIADAEGIERSLRARHPKMGHSVVLEYGADVLEDAPSRRPVEDLGLVPGKYFLCVGRLEPENHIEEIVRGVSHSGTTLPLVVVGDHRIGGRYVTQLVRGANAQVRFVGAVYDRSSLASLRYHALAHFHGHSVGGTNPSLLEALACGNTIAAHDNVFNREVLGDVGLYFVTPDDIAELARCFSSMSDDERCARAGAGRRRIIERYTWDAIANRYCEWVKREVPRSMVRGR